jgi:uncharacterized membrane protein
MKTLDKKEIKRQLDEMLDAGRSKTETFKAFSGGAVKDRVLAYWIGSRIDPALRRQYARKVTILIVLTCIQALLGALAGFVLGWDSGIGLALTLMLIGGGIPLLFAWGFYKYSAQTYTVFVILTLSQVSRLFKDYAEDPISTLIGVGLTLAMVYFVVWLKTKLFPDLGFIGSKKIKGQFVFSN